MVRAHREEIGVLSDPIAEINVMILIGVFDVLMVIRPWIDTRVFNINSCIMIKKIVRVAA